MEFISTQYEEMCRACMSRNSANSNEKTIQLKSIFYYVDDCENRNIRICELLNKTVLQLPKVEVEDALPKYLCSQCLEKLCSFYEFQNCCIIADLRLRQLIEANYIDKDLSDPLQSDIGDMQEFIKKEVELCETDKVTHALQSKVSFISDNYEEDEKSKSEYLNKNLSLNDADVINEADDNENGNESDGSKLVGNTRIVSCETHKIDTSKIIKQQWVCDICKQYFLHHHNFQRHQQKVHNIKTENNKIDAVQDSSELNMEQTSAVETGISTNTNHNNKSSNVENSNQSKKQRYGCDICTKTFAEKRSLQRHIRTIHKKDTKLEAPMQIVQLSDAVSTSKVIINKENEINDMLEQNKEIENKAPLKLVPGINQPNSLSTFSNSENSFSIIKESQESNENTTKKGFTEEKAPNRIWFCEICKNVFPFKGKLIKHMKTEHSTKAPPLNVEMQKTKEIEDEKQLNSETDNVNILHVDGNKKPCNNSFKFKIKEISKVETINAFDLNYNESSIDENVNYRLNNAQNETNVKNGGDCVDQNDETYQKSSKAKIYKCDLCDTVLKKKYELSRHMQRHEQPNEMRKIKSCEICNQGCRTSKKLLEHYTTMHPDRLQSDELPVPLALKCIFCPYCKKGTNHLIDHLRTHTKEKPFLCSQCGKGYSSKGGLKQHIMRHSNEKHYSCPDCPKKFTCSSDLCSHRYVHKPGKLHVCDVCGSAFKKTYELRKHKIIHTNEKKYKCEYCGRSFMVRDHLKRHLRTHTGEKPYKCKFCPRSFSQSNDMVKHMRSHVGEKVYDCELCPAAFRLASELRTHFYTHKNDDEETKQRNKQALMEAQEKLRIQFESQASTL